MIMDWDKEGQGEYQIYPEGTYKVTINGYGNVTASTGTKQLRWKASIISPAEYVGKPITMHTPLTEKSLWKLARLVKACGVDLKALGKTEVSSKKFNEILSSCLRRSTFWHVVVTPDNNGHERNEIDDFKRDPEQQDVVISAEDVPDFLKEK